MHTTSHVLHSRKSQVPYILNVHKAGKVPKQCITQCDSVHAGPLKVMGVQFIGSSLKAVGALLILVTQTSGGGSQTDSVFPTLGNIDRDFSTLIRLRANGPSCCRKHWLHTRGL